MKRLLTLLVLATILFFCDANQQSLGFVSQITPKKGAIPIERPLHACQIVEDTIYVYGGRTGVSTWANTMHSFNLQDYSWTRNKIVSPTSKEAPSLAGHTMTYVNNKLYIFGGRSGFFEYNQEVYEYTIDTQTIKVVETQADRTFGKPKARQSHSATLLSDGKTILIYGGNDGSTTLNDVWLFDTEDKAWAKKEINSAEHVEGHSAVLYEGDVYIFGGFSAAVFKSEVFALNTTTWELEKFKPNIEIAPRATHTATLMGHYVFLVGGVNTNDVLNDVDVINLRTRRLIKDAQVEGSFIARQGHCAISYGTKIIVFGGARSLRTPYNDMFEIETNPSARASAEPASSGDTDDSFNVNVVENTILQIEMNYGAPANKTYDHAKLDEEAKEIQSQVTEQEHADLTAQINSWKKIEGLLNALHKSKDEMQSKVSRLRYELSQVGGHKDQYEQSRQETMKLLDDLRKTKDEYKKLKTDIQLVSSRLVEASENDKQAKATVRASEENLANLRKQESDKKARIVALEADISANKKKIERLQKKIENTDFMGKQDDQREGILIAKREALEEKLSQLKNQVDQMQNKFISEMDEKRKVEEQLRNITSLQTTYLDIRKKYEEAANKTSQFIQSTKGIIAEEAPSPTDMLISLNHIAEALKLKQQELEEKLSADEEKRVQDELKASRIQLKETEEEVNALKKEIENLRSKRELRKQENSTFNSDLSAAESDLKEKAAILESEKSALTDLSVSVNNAQNTFDDAIAKVKETKKIFDEVNTFSQNSASAILAKEQILRSQFDQVKESIRTTDTLQKRYDEVNAKLLAALNEFYSQKNTIKSAADELNNEKKRAISEYDTKIKEMSNEIQQLKDNLEKCKQESTPMTKDRAAEDAVIAQENVHTELDLQDKRTINAV